MKHVTITRNNAGVSLGITLLPTPRNGGKPESQCVKRPVGAAILRAGKPA